MISSLVRMFHRALSRPAAARRPVVRDRRSVRLAVESLETRLAPAVTPMVAASFFDSALYEMDASTGTVLQTLVAPNSQATLQGPAGMTVGPDGNLYLASQFNDAIVKFDVSTKTLSTFLGSGVLNPIASTTGLTNFKPSGLAFGPDGNLYVSLNGGQGATSGGAVVRFAITNTAGTLSYAGTNAFVATGLVQPTEMTFGTSATTFNTLYVSNSAAGNVIKINNADGATPIVSTFIAAGTGTMNYPTGLTWGPDGKFYVVDLAATATHKGQILRFTASGAFEKVFTTPANSLLNQFPADMLFTPSGRFLSANLGPTYPVTFGGPGTSGSIYEFIASNGKFNRVLSSVAFPAALVGTTPVTNFSPSQLTLDAGNRAPVANAGNPTSLNEGASLYLHASATDADGDKITTYTWDLNGDGIFGDAVGAKPVVSWAKLKSLGLDSADDFQARVIARDSRGQTDVSEPIQVTINHLPPTLKISGPTRVAEESVYTLNLSGKASPGHVITGWTIHWGDGTTTPVVGNPKSVTHTYLSGPNNFTITATAVDDESALATSNTWSVAVLHVAPKVVLSGAATVNEASVFTLNLAATTKGGHAIQHYTINWNDGSAPEVVSGSATSVDHVYARGPRNHRITVTATDDVGTYKATNTHLVRVLHVAPVLTINGPSTIVEGSVYQLDLSAAVTAGHAIKSWTISWGDGSRQTVPGTTTSVTHVFYARPTNFTIKVSARDDVGSYAAQNSIVVQVDHLPPLLNIIGPSAGTVGQAYVLNLSGLQPLPTKHAIRSWLITWGDGTTTLVKGNPATVKHVYKTAGVFNITAKATDDIGTYDAANPQTVTIA